MNSPIIRIKLLLQRKLAIVFLIIMGIIPLLWLKQGYVIGNGDYFPLWFNSHKTLNLDIHLWSHNYLGNANTFASFTIYELIWWLLSSLGLGVELAQILTQILFFMGAGLSMYYLSKIVYPKLKLSPIISSIFYMFNFFVLQSRLNVGFSWTCVFLPLLMALLIKIIDAAYQQDNKAVNKITIYFAVTSTIALSFASINPPNVILVLLCLAIIILYNLLIHRRQIRPLLLTVMKIAVISIPINLWWLIPVLNYYLWSPLILNSQISVTAWSWTQGRASFLNLFWLNGVWGWSPEYFPYYDSYSNPFLIVLTFVPFLLAATALLFKSNKSRLNAYIMLSILFFLFLAKGLHEPFSQLNLLLYTYIPGMEMFREPTSKFTMAVMPFLALLIGYAVEHIANMKISRIRPTNFTKTLIATFFIATFIVAAYPLVTNPIETKTQQLPFSSYVKIPDYWYQTADWLGNKRGDYKVLITPPDDFYQMPYTWGYYGTDQFLERLIQKPLISTYYAYSYKTNPDTTIALQQLQSVIKYNRAIEFKAFLDLLNIRYILQRNDIQCNFTGRNIIPPNEMQAFLTQQPYIRLAQKFGQLEIYEYTESKPYMYTIEPSTFQQTAIRIENVSTLEKTWNFTSLAEVQEWQNSTPPDQWQTTYIITQDDNSLRAELWNSTWGWKTINSPLLPAQYGDTYQIQADIKGQNAHQVHIKMAEYDTNKKLLTTNYLAGVNDGTFNWTLLTLTFEPINRTTKYLQIQVWHGHETDKPLPNIIWVDNVKIHGYTIRLNTKGIDLIFPNTTQNQPATILNYTKVNPTKITATINATQPFILAISEALDQSWKANFNGKQIENTPLYLGLKGFQINQTGLFEVTLEYEPQKWFYYGSIISVSTLFVCLIYLTYNYTKSKNIWKQIKKISYRRRITAKQTN